MNCWEKAGEHKTWKNALPNFSVTLKIKRLNFISIMNDAFQHLQFLFIVPNLFTTAVDNTIMHNNEPLGFLLHV